jgi:hypothetical protein
MHARPAARLVCVSDTTSLSMHRSGTVQDGQLCLEAQLQMHATRLAKATPHEKHSTEAAAPADPSLPTGVQPLNSIRSLQTAPHSASGGGQVA